MDPANCFILQGDQSREGGTSTRGHRGYQALLSRPPAKLEVRREFFSNSVVEGNKKLPDRVKMSTNMNMFKDSLELRSFLVKHLSEKGTSLIFFKSIFT